MDYSNMYAWTDKLGDTIHDHLGIALLIMVFGGILSAVSPSTVPRMVAIVNYVGRESISSASAASLSLAFVAGICVVYGSVGLLAGSFGELLKMTGFLYDFTAALCFVMGLAMIRVIDVKARLPLPPILSRGWLGAFLLGFGFAFLIAPDATPFMITALAVTTFTGHLLTGAALMLAFGVGHSAPVFFVGMLAPLYKNNVAFKRWHVAAEMAAGYVLVFLAVFFWKIA